MQITTPAYGKLLFDGQHRTWDDQDPMRGRASDVRLYRGEQVGSKTGYSSLGAAIRAASFITDDTNGLRSDALVAVADGARYALFAVTERFANAAGSFLGQPSEPANFEYHEDFIAHDAQKPSYEHANLRALIDGGHIQRFAPGNVAPGVRP